MPALLTRMSMRPPRMAVLSSASSRLRSALPSRSAGTKLARPPNASISLTTAAPRSGLRPDTTTWAPSAAKASAMARPMLLVAPVTRAFLPARRVPIDWTIWSTMPGIEWTVKSTLGRPAGRGPGWARERTVDEVERVLTAKGTATRQRIVAGAAGLVRDQGAANVSLDDIRTVTSTSKSQLFHYFPDGRSDLLLAVAPYEAPQGLDDQQPMLGQLTSPAAWEAWRDRVIEKYRAQGPGCPLSALTSQLGLADPATRTVIVDMYARWQDYLADGVRALAAAGEIDAATDVADAATANLTAVAGGATMLMATGQISYLEVALDEALSGLART